VIHMKLKKVLATATLGLGILAFSQLAITADKKDMEKLVNATLQEGETYVTRYGNLQYLKKIEQIDKKTERRIHFVVKYFESNGKKFVDNAHFVIEDWIETENVKGKEPYVTDDEVFPNGYIINQKIIQDYMYDGIVDKYSTNRIIETDQNRVLDYESKSLSLENTANREEAQKIYDDYVEIMLDYIEKI